MIEILVALTLIGGLLLGLEIAFRLGQRAKLRGSEEKAQMGAIQRLLGSAGTSLDPGC